MGCVWWLWPMLCWGEEGSLGHFQELGLTSPQHSTSKVEQLLHRHGDLEKLLAVQEERFTHLQETAEV